jgi:hypothetical protein
VPTARFNIKWTDREKGILYTQAVECEGGEAKLVGKAKAKRIGGSRGLGDTIAKVTSAVGIKPCGGCKERQEKLNRLVPYRGKDRA